MFRKTVSGSSSPGHFRSIVAEVIVASWTIPRDSSQVSCLSDMQRAGFLGWLL